jgi:hypothetical protein
MGRSWLLVRFFLRREFVNFPDQIAKFLQPWGVYGWWSGSFIMVGCVEQSKVEEQT